MRREFRICAVFLAMATAAHTADPDPQELFRKVRARVLDDVSHVPRYTCVQTVDRAQYRPQYGTRPANCRAMIAARRQLTSPGYLITRDRLRLDVAVVDGVETFSWAGARRFETSHLDDLVKSGATGSGEFVAYLNSIFGADTDTITWLGQSMFGYNVPYERSHYRYHTTGPDRITGYHGAFLVDPATAELKQLSVIADEFPPGEAACRLEDSMEYHRVKIGNGDFPLPASATMDVLFNEGLESVNRISYSDCHEYTGESTIRFDDGDSPNAATATDAVAQKDAPAQKEAAQVRELPPDLRFSIALTSPIHSETAAAGDPVTGELLRDVKDRKLGIVAREHDVVHGRILQMEQHMYPFPRWILAIRFDTLEHDGRELPISLRPRDGRNAFTFAQSGYIVIDKSFHSEWESR
jgi:hypothetical protein